jgi:hypothetical protein
MLEELERTQLVVRDPPHARERCCCFCCRCVPVCIVDHAEGDRGGGVFLNGHHDTLLWSKIEVPVRTPDAEEAPDTSALEKAGDGRGLGIQVGAAAVVNVRQGVDVSSAVAGRPETFSKSVFRTTRPAGRREETAAGATRRTSARESGRDFCCLLVLAL